jgi:hypothetical protein
MSDAQIEVLFYATALMALASTVFAYVVTLW